MEIIFLVIYLWYNYNVNIFIVVCDNLNDISSVIVHKSHEVSHYNNLSYVVEY